MTFGNNQFDEELDRRFLTDEQRRLVRLRLLRNAALEVPVLLLFCLTPYWLLYTWIPLQNWFVVFAWAVFGSRYVHAWTAKMLASGVGIFDGSVDVVKTPTRLLIYEFIFAICVGGLVWEFLL